MPLRNQLAARGMGSDRHFHWRGGEVTRLEGFSDAVFGFALTLLVVSLQVPRTYTELVNVMRGFFAFGLCFYTLFTIWTRHYLFFRRYGLQDGPTVWLNSLLLFVVLFYVYPLKFVDTLFIEGVLGLGGGHIGAVGGSDISGLFVIFGLGFVTVYCIFAALYFHAWRKRRLLELDPCETFTTYIGIWRHFGIAAVGMVSVLMAVFIPMPYTGFSGFAYFLLGVVEATFGAMEGRGQARELARMAASHEDALATQPRSPLPLIPEASVGGVIPAKTDRELAEIETREDIAGPDRSIRR